MAENAREEEDRIEEDEADCSDPSKPSAAMMSYEDLSKDELVELCRSRGIKAQKRWRETTLIARLQASDQE